MLVSLYPFLYPLYPKLVQIYDRPRANWKLNLYQAPINSTIKQSSSFPDTGIWYRTGYHAGSQATNKKHLRINETTRLLHIQRTQIIRSTKCYC